MGDPTKVKTADVVATGGPDRECLLVLGMHRSGTSALTRVFNLLGYGLPDHLIGALEGNEAGHWEPENVVLFNDRILADMNSAWHDFRSLPTHRISPEALANAQRQARDILAADYHDTSKIVIKDPRLCRFTPLYHQALSELNYRVVPIIQFRNASEVIRSLQRRSVNWPVGFTESEAALMWLRYVLDAELHTRGQQRSFLEFRAMMSDWKAEFERLSDQAGISFPNPIKDAAPLIEEFLRPDLYHEVEGEGELSAKPAIRGWCHRAYDALRQLVVAPESASAMGQLDKIRSEFAAAELALGDMSTAHVSAFADLSGKMDEAKGKIQGLTDALAKSDDDLSRSQAELKSLQRDIAGLRETRTAEKAELAQSSTLLADRDAKIAELNRLFHERNLQIDQMQLRAEQMRQEFLTSRSWRVSAPLRWGSTRARGVRNTYRNFLRASAAMGGLLPGTRHAFRILTKEGPKGLRARLKNVNAPYKRTFGAANLAVGIDEGTCFIAATHHVMSLAEMMGRVLHEEGFRVVISDTLDGARGAGHVFVICPQMFGDLPDNYIAIQMEQTVSSRWFDAGYLEKLNLARSIIDYSTINLGFLRRNGIPTYKLHYVPIDTDRAVNAGPAAGRSGILFYGDDKCPRRQRILEAVGAAYPNLKIINNLFGEELQDELRRAAVVLNIHYYEDALLETTRVYQALSCGTPVVSEMSSDQAEHQMLEGIVDFAPIDDIDRIIELLRPYAEGGSQATEKYRQIETFRNRPDNRFEMFFRRFLLAQEMIGYDAMTERAPEYPMPLPENIRLCLSLPETPERRALFVGQDRHDFQIWDGLKANPGWIGAAFSYRQMFERITKAGADRAVICEDDVLFPDNFEARLETIERYLQRHDWDIFSGFIADIRDELQIVDVEEFEGETFVHLDRTVSMVFNIYNRDIMEFLSQWSPEDRDVYRNTIDRYLENHGDTKIITTVPFLVKHRPDATSTVWGFENTQYDELVEKSETLLLAKLAEFKKRQETTS